MEGAGARANAPASILASAVTLRPSAGAAERARAATCAGPSPPAQSPVSLRLGSRPSEAMAAGPALPRGPLKCSIPNRGRACLLARPAPGALVLWHHSIKLLFEVKPLVRNGPMLLP